MNSKNDVPNSFKTNQIYEFKDVECKGNKYEIICITIQLLMASITPLNQMQKRLVSTLGEMIGKLLQML